MEWSLRKLGQMDLRKNYVMNEFRDKEYQEWF